MMFHVDCIEAQCGVGSGTVQKENEWKEEVISKGEWEERHISQQLPWQGLFWVEWYCEPPIVSSIPEAETSYGTLNAFKLADHLSVSLSL